MSRRSLKLCSPEDDGLRPCQSLSREHHDELSHRHVGPKRRIKIQPRTVTQAIEARNGARSGGYRGIVAARRVLYPGVHELRVRMNLPHQRFEWIFQLQILDVDPDRPARRAFES